MVRGRRNPLHFGLAARLKKARKDGNLSRLRVAKTSGLSDSVIHAIETDQRVPLIDTVERIAEALGVSPCSLAYGIDGPFVPAPALRSAGVSERLRQARAQAGLSKLALSQRAGLARGTVLYLEVGKTLPTVATAEQLAKALGVSVCWLAYGEGA